MLGITHSSRESRGGSPGWARGWVDRWTDRHRDKRKEEMSVSMRSQALKRTERALLALPYKLRRVLS